MTETKPFIALNVKEPQVASGIPVLLIHGFYASGAQDWPADHWANILARHGRKVIVVDLPAHGESARVANAKSATTTDIVDALAGIVTKQGAPVDVVGYSLGARLGWALASKYPELVNRALLGGLSPADPFAALDYSAARKFADDGTPPSDQMTAMIVGMAVGEGKDSHALINLMEGLGSEPFDPVSEAPRCPVLLVAGTEDHIASDIGSLEVHLAQARTERVPGDHFGALHSPQFRETAFRFLGVS